MSKPLDAMTLSELERLARSNRSNSEVLERVLEELSGRYSYDARQLRERVIGWLESPPRRHSPQAGTEEHSESLHSEATHAPPDVERNEFGIADERDFQLIQVLERMRERLLDLSNRNPLLSYRHPNTRSLRVVAEVPTQVFSRLLGNTAMTFVPLSIPDQTDLSFLQIDLPAPVEGETKWKKKRARQEAERVAMARRLGIDPSYDLPPIANSEEENHNDRRLQTLLRPHELEKLLHTLHRDSVTAVQESGANLLHLMFGFVEWRDVSTGDNDQPVRFAPLVLLPVALSRADLDPNTHTYKYSVEATGEDWSTNITLQMKCRKEFGFELPMIGDEDESIEEYFQRVEESLENMQGWRVRRFLTLGLVSFGKILMWRDLDPTNWPKQKPLLGNCLLRGVLGEADKDDDRGPGDPIVSEYPIDDLSPDEGVHLPLITDADSSQHSVLVDVRRGTNLVVQGPPGTGKSQTITNLIGDALSRGKKVLFVAEKKAALDVVVKRLNEAGLARFCLSLHSHTSQKREFLDDLISRLNLRGNTQPVREIRTAQELADELRAELAAHADALHQRFGAIELTPFQIFWRARRLADQLGSSVIQLLKQVRIEDSTAAAPADVQRARAALERFAAAFDRVQQEAGDLSSHPWTGVGNEALTFQEVEALVEAAAEWQIALEGVLTASRDLVSHTGVPTSDSLLRLALFAEQVTAVPMPSPQVPPHLPLAIVESADVPIVREAISKVARARTAWQEVDGKWGAPGAITPEEGDRLRDVLKRAEREFGSALTPVAASALATRCLDALHKIERLNRWTDLLEETIGISLPRTPQVVGRYAAAIDSFSRVDDLALDLRSAETREPQATSRVELLAHRASKLRSEAERLDQTFDRALRPDAAQLKEHVTALSTAPAFLPRLWSGSYRRAVASYRAMTGGARVKREEMTAGMRGLLAHTLAVSAFEEDESLRSLFGRHARGLDTPVAAALELLSWWESIADAHRGIGSAGPVLEHALWTAPSQTWRDAVSITRSDAEITDIATGFESLMEDVRQRFVSATGSWSQRSLDGLVEQLSDSRDLLTEVVGVGESAGAPSIHVEALQNRLAMLRAAWSAEDELTRFAELFRSIGISFQGPGTDTTAVAAAIEYLAALYGASLPAELCRWLVEPDPAERARVLKDAVAELRRALGREEAARKTFLVRGRVAAHEWLASEGSGSASLEEAALNTLARRLDQAMEAPETLHSWAAYQRARTESDRLTQKAVVRNVESGRLPSAHAADFYEAALFRSLADAVFRLIPNLNLKTGDGLTVTRRRFAEQDERWINFVRRELTHTLNQAPAHPGVGFGPVAQLTDEALIKHEAGKTRRHIPIRQMLRRAGTAILEMKPCFLMGPQAVAQYLAPGMFEFDIVVMDEASQMRPEDALGAIARGKQLVVVGDPKQLGPTRFFDRISDDDDDLEDVAEVLRLESGAAEREDPLPQGPTVLERSESILMAAAARYPTRLLRWHYRSKHPKLIAFSNREFYNENLIIFPAPGGTDVHDGVFFRPIAGGLYEARARRNVPEAKAVVNAICGHAREYPRRSLLVATLNSSQAELIDELLQETEKDDPILSEFRRRFAGGLEPLVVKNLENVQGDERDAIFVSVTFGRNSDGRLYQYFGPITQRGGERRLNVLFTRAKYRLDIFCSFDPSDLRVEAESSPGLQIFHGYLRYAQDAETAYGRPTGRSPDSDFEVAVADALAARGFEVRCQVGVAGYFIDLGIVHPDQPGRFILGVECDGASYHSSRSARDRDRLREMVLRNEFHWNLHRVWSTDWFRDPRGEMDRIIRAIETKLGEERQPPRESVGDVPPAPENTPTPA